MTMKANDNLKRVASVVFLGALLISSQSVFARATGTTTWQEGIGSSYTDSATYVTYISTQGAQGTSWVWRWQKVYPKFITFCAAPSCTVSANETRSESVATQVGFDATGSGVFSGLTPTLKGSFARTWTTTQSFGFSWNATIRNGMNAYGGVIALDKYIPAADIRGVWQRTGRSKLGACFEGGCSTLYEYRWNNEQTIGVWKGHQLAQHRTFLCGTTTTLTPTVGGGLPSGCSLPQIPY